MGKQARKDEERRPIELQVKLGEMEKVKNDIHKALKGSAVNEEKGTESRVRGILREAAKKVLKTGAEPVSLKLKKVHALGDVVGRFHPSKSRKGIKRSE